MARPAGLRPEAAALTLFLVGAAIVVYALPPLADELVYDRGAILRGDWWRLFTAPLVHFSASHLGWNLAVFGAAGWAVAAAGYRGFGLVCALAAILPGPLLLLSAPELARYGGLSGLATGAVSLFCLCRAFGERRGRLPCLAILVLIAAKIAAEASMGAPLFAQVGRIPFRVLPAVHAAGFLAAWGVVVSTWRNRG